VVAKKVQQAKGKVALFGLSPNVREVFTVSGFDTIFSVVPDSAAAIAAVRYGSPALLSLVEEITLLLLDDTQGRFVDLTLSASAAVVAGAAQRDLALANPV